MCMHATANMQRLDLSPALFADNALLYLQVGSRTQTPVSQLAWTVIYPLGYLLAFVLLSFPQNPKSTCRGSSTLFTQVTIQYLSVQWSSREQDRKSRWVERCLRLYHTTHFLRAPTSSHKPPRLQTGHLHFCVPTMIPYLTQTSKQCDQAWVETSKLTTEKSLRFFPGLYHTSCKSNTKSLLGANKILFPSHQLRALTRHESFILKTCRGLVWVSQSYNQGECCILFYVFQGSICLPFSGLQRCHVSWQVKVFIFVSQKWKHYLNLLICFLLSLRDFRITLVYAKIFQAFIST